MTSVALEIAARDLPFQIQEEKVTPELLAEKDTWIVLKEKALERLEALKKSCTPFTRLERLAATRVLDQLNLLWQIREAKKETIALDDEVDKLNRFNMLVVVKAKKDCEVVDALLGPIMLSENDVRPLPYKLVRELLERGAVEAL